MLVVDGGRRNLSDGWRYKLESSKKDILSEIGRGEMAKAGEKFKPSMEGLSIVDKPSVDAKLLEILEPEIIETIET